MKKNMTESLRKLVTLFPALTDIHKDRIRHAVSEHGFQVIFCRSKEDAIAEISDAEVYLGMDGEVVSHGSGLRWVCTPSSGAGHLIGFLKDTGIMLTNSSGAYGVTISEHIIMVTLELMRRKMEYIELIRHKKWKNDLSVRSIRGARITLLGTGNIGQETAVRLRAFSPKAIIGVNRRGNNPENLFDSIVPISDIDNILPQTDLLISSLPSTDETRDLLSADRLHMLPLDAYLVNVGRGDTLDQDALERMLRNGTLGGAALDVFREEPLPVDSTLWDCPRLIISTHSSGTWTLPYTVERIVDLFLEDFENYCIGKNMARIVDLNAGY